MYVCKYSAFQNRKTVGSFNAMDQCHLCADLKWLQQYFNYNNGAIVLISSFV